MCKTLKMLNILFKSLKRFTTPIFVVAIPMVIGGQIKTTVLFI